MKIGGVALPALRRTKGEDLRVVGFSKMAAKAAIVGAWWRVALVSGRPHTCPISVHSRSANASVPPISKKLSSGLSGDRCSTRCQISVRVSAVVYMS
jgi:hypothetical protein